MGIIRANALAHAIWARGLQEPFRVVANQFLKSTPQAGHICMAMTKSGRMTTENSKPLNQQQTARERRLKEALRVNLQRRRQKAHAHRADDQGDEKTADAQNTDVSDKN